MAEQNNSHVTSYLVLARRDLHLQLWTLAMDHGTADCVSVRPVICHDKYSAQTISAVFLHDIHQRCLYCHQYRITST